MPSPPPKTMTEKKEDIGKIVDKYIKQRVSALNQLIKAENELAKLGVKFGVLDENGIPSFELGDNYLPTFLYHLQEYEWEAVYKDGTILRQYGVDGEHHFGDIDQENLKEIRYISNFEYPTDNKEKRIILTLDWETGKFDLLNGLLKPADDRAKLSREVKGKKKLILFRRIRYGQMLGTTNAEGNLVTPFPTDEIYFYKRYYLGYETKDRKILICLYPNGEVRVEEYK